MSLDQGLFLMVGSDIDDDELKSFRHRLKKKCKKRKVSSLSPSPASSSPPDSDNNSPYSTGSLSLVSTSKMPAIQNEQQESPNRNRKRKIASDIVHRFLSKKKKSTLSSSSASERGVLNSKLIQPSSWCKGDTSHFIEPGETEFNRRCDLTPQTFTPQFKRGKGKSVKKSDLAGANAPKTCNSTSTPQATTADCLTGCKSCSVYTLPDVSVEENEDTSCYLAVDCEFVGVGPQKTSALGRCSIVNYSGYVVFDRFVKPPEEVTDYRTPWSGLRPRHIRCGIPLVAAQEMIATIIKDKVVVGHAVFNDFRVMGLRHPARLIRDTASCKMLTERANLQGNACALKKLTSALLGRTIQKKEHCSVTDARASMDLFRLVRPEWEPILQAKFRRRAARQFPQQVAEGQGDDESDPDPELNSFFDDVYWPDD